MPLVTIGAREEITNCTCGSIGRTDGIRFCEQCHCYWFNDQEMVSVSKVLRTLYPIDFSRIPPDVLEIARLRGQFVDRYFSEWLVNPHSVVSLGEMKDMIVGCFPRDGEKYAEDTIDRTKRLMDWWEARQYKAREVQEIFYSEADGIAGRIDVATEDMVLDIKNHWSIERQYALQLGAYLSMDKQPFPLRNAGIIHVTKKDVKLLTYDAKKIREQWKSAAAWFRTRRELEK